jgi:two-component system sensor histidine kinase GlrK
MKLTIFSRLVIGYLAIFVLAMGVSIYAIAQLRELEDVSRTILSVDNRMITYEQKLTDIMLSMIRYEKKFIILKDDSLYDQFIGTKKEFEKSYKELLSLAETDEMRSLLESIKERYDSYCSLFEIEAAYVRSGQDYSAGDFKLKKEDHVNFVMAGLKNLRSLIQANTYMKVKSFGEAEGSASRVAIIMGIVSLAAGILISIYITMNITRPLNQIKKRTDEIARGEFREDLNLESSPEIADLARAFNIMCRKLKEIDKLKSDFFSLMSHELRTPLTTIKEGTNLLIEGMGNDGEGDKMERLLNIISEESNRLINLVNSLLDLSKMEAGMMVFNFTRTDVANLIGQVAREIEPLAETRKIRIETSVRDGLPSIKADRERVLQVLRNLMGNAVKFTPEGGSVTVSSMTVNGGVSVSVADTGAGIAEENLGTIFDKYQQVTLAGSSKIKGTGLGLSIVKHIIDAHGGKIWVESSPGKGSVFTFVLPRS